MPHRTTALALVSLPRGVYRYDTPDPSQIVVEVWTADGTRLLRGLMPRTAFDAREAIAWLDLRDPLRPARPTLTLHRSPPANHPPPDAAGTR